MRRAVAMTGALILVVALAAPAAAGGGGCYERPQDRAAYPGDRVYLAMNCFGPTVVRVRPGTNVTWVNKDATNHTVTGAGSTWGMTVGDLAQGQHYSYRFDHEGTFPYFCMFHIGMVGAVVVGDGAGDGVASAGGGAPVGPAAGSSGSGRVAVEQGSALPLAGLVGLVALCVLLVGYVLVRQGKRHPEQRDPAGAGEPGPMGG